MELTHASFFSGAGGLDLGLERAGWRTVSFSEIDPYASAVLAERWPGVPNLGDITRLAGVDGAPRPLVAERRRNGPSYRDATLWTGGFPCQDLSVAGKRRGLAGERSGLAFAFLELVERHRPPAVLLENVPGLLSSHGGRDLGALLGTLGELGYGWAYRVLDARHFGVPQRRRRVFILGIHARVDPSGQRAAEVLSVGSRCDRHPPAGIEAGTNAADGLAAGISRSLSTSQQRIDADTESFIVDDGRSTSSHTAGTLRVGPADVTKGGPGDTVPIVIRTAADADRDGAADGLAGRTHHRRRLADEGIVQALDAKGGGVDDNEAQAGHLVTVYRRGARPHSADEAETWEPADIANNLNGWDLRHGEGNELVAVGDGVLRSWGPRPDLSEHDRLQVLLPQGLDSHRYRCCGNGVVSSVAEWIGTQLLRAIEAAA